MRNLESQESDQKAQECKLKVIDKIYKTYPKSKKITEDKYELDNQNFVLIYYSKFHKPSNVYWFTIRKNVLERFYSKGLFILFICKTEETVFVLPAKILEFLYYCKTTDRGDWKLDIRREKDGFYLIKYRKNENQNPIKILISSYLNKFELLSVSGTDLSNLYTLAQEVKENNKYYEGATTKIWVNSYERDDKARKKCLAHYGLNCCICGFNFEKIYGAVGKGYMQVHHLKPLSEIKEKYEVNPINDLRPVCPNCHAMIHRLDPPYSIEEMLTFYKQHNS